MAGKHNAKTTDAPALNAPAQWVPATAEVPLPSGDGPQQYDEPR